MPSMTKHVWFLGQQWNKIHGRRDEMTVSHVAAPADIIRVSLRLQGKYPLKPGAHVIKLPSAPFQARWSEMRRGPIGYGADPEEAIRALGVRLAADLREHFMNENEDLSAVMQASIGFIESKKDNL